MGDDFAEEQDLDDERASELEAIGVWLRANVRIVERASQIRLFRFEWPREDSYAGSFSLALDDQLFEGCRFYADGAGHIQFAVPMFTSPLGAPASFASVELSDDIARAVRAALGGALPRLKPYGIDSETGELLTTATPLHRRLATPLTEIRDRLLQQDLLAGPGDEPQP